MHNKKCQFNPTLNNTYLDFFNVERTKHSTTEPAAIASKYNGQLLTVAVIFLFYSPFNCARHSSMKSLLANEYEKAVAPPHAVPIANASS